MVMFMRSRLGRLIMWMSLAAAATYFFDPDQGEKRRRQLRMTFERMRRSSEETMRNAQRTAQEQSTKLDTRVN